MDAKHCLLDKVRARMRAHTKHYRQRRLKPLRPYFDFGSVPIPVFSFDCSAQSHSLGCRTRHQVRL